MMVRNGAKKKVVSAINFFSFEQVDQINQSIKQASAYGITVTIDSIDIILKIPF